MRITSHYQLSNQKRNWHKTRALLLKVKIAVSYMHQFNYSPTQIISPAKAKQELQVNVSGLPWVNFRAACMRCLGPLQRFGPTPGYLRDFSLHNFH